MTKFLLEGVKLTIHSGNPGRVQQCYSVWGWRLTRCGRSCSSELPTSWLCCFGNWLLFVLAYCFISSWTWTWYHDFSWFSITSFNIFFQLFQIIPTIQSFPSWNVYWHWTVCLFVLFCFCCFQFWNWKLFLDGVCLFFSKITLKTIFICKKFQA